ncbi:phosphotransferase [Gracilibacillus sp. YIM 98692]|uniref:phosphotransferase n=1 Tax=Gracilibacillus sp. YIM 98692 TaxID=2663532 RepID=UPI0013D52438|nr:phosphotransferase [Gracilibacillus sp. YIM 98692]
MDWKQLAKAYEIEPIEIYQVTNRVYKIQTRSQNYALKHSHLTKESIGRWLALYQYIQQQQIYGFVPVYLTNQQMPFYAEDENIYYLMPWVENHALDRPSHEYASLFHSLGKLHAATIHKHDLSSIKNSQESYQEYYRNQTQIFREQLLQYVRYFEAKRFMSPFELQVCMTYRDIDFLLYQLDHWQEIHFETLGETADMNYSLCHGNLKLTHFVSTYDQTYLLNWEYAHFAPAIHDLVLYFSHIGSFHDIDLPKVTEAFDVYGRYLPISDFEKSLLVMELLSPDSWLQCIHSYMDVEVTTPQIDSVIMLEREYRKLMFHYQLQEHIASTLTRKNEEAN